MTGSDLPAWLRRADLSPLDRRFAYQREARMWAVEFEGVEVVVRALDPAALLPPSRDALIARRRWMHEFLERLLPTGFPAPRPVPVFSGQTLLEHEGQVWEALTYLPGEEVGWRGTPAMTDIGSFLARYHHASEAIEVEGQPPGAVPLTDVRELVVGAPWSEMTDDMAAVQEVCALAETLAAELERINAPTPPAHAVHGDPTNMNVLASGSPPAPSGLIDFGGAYADRLLADVGFGLWQSGRPRFDADLFDPARVTAFVAGYASVRPLPADAARAIPVYMLGRGLQMVAKRAVWRVPFLNQGHVSRLMWLRSHLDSLEAALCHHVRGG